MAKQDGKIHRLEDLLVEEVSIVDRPANLRRFLTVKQEGGMKEKGIEIQVDAAGKLVTTESKPDPKPDAPLSIAKSFEEIGEAIEKRLTIPGDLRTDMFRSLNEIVGRIHTVMNMTDFAQDDRKVSDASTLLPVLATEIGEVSKLLAKVSRQVAGTKETKKNDPEPAEKPDDQPQVSEATAQLTALVETLESAVEKRGAKMSKNRLAQFKAAMVTLAGLLTDLEGSSAGPDDKSKGGDVKKADEIPAHVAKAIEGLTMTVDKLTGMVQKQGKDLFTLRKSRPNSNVLLVDDGAPTKQDDGTSWPMDLNSAP